MDFGSLLLILSLTVVVVGYVARPLLDKRGFLVTEEGRRISELQAERDQVLLNLQEMDMDHSMGKIPAEDYQKQRPVLVAQGVAILKELDQLTGVEVSHSPEEDKGLGERSLDEQIEEEVLRHRKGTAESGVGFCPQCGNEIHVGDKFCTSCGAQVHVIEVEA